MKKVTGIFGVAALMLLVFGVGVGHTSLEEVDYAAMVENLKAALPNQKKDLPAVTPEYRAWLHQQAKSYFAQIESGQVAPASQFFLLVDRHPERQLMLAAFYDAVNQNITDIGYSSVSTGNPKRRGHFVTPLGIFINTPEIKGYRALGTMNDQGWRGLGVKGSRVWDFGWQPTIHERSGKQEIRYIRLLLHATDPQYGEERLGKPDSKGCIRTSNSFNRFIDHYGLIDREYEERKNEPFCAYLLRRDRSPVPFAGKYLFICDSKGVIF